MKKLTGQQLCRRMTERSDDHRMGTTINSGMVGLGEGNRSGQMWGRGVYGAEQNELHASLEWSGLLE